MAEIAINSVYEVLHNYGARVVSALTDNLDAQGNSVTGALASSIVFTITDAGEASVFKLNLLDYYTYLDQGRKPGKMPPINAIRNWLSIRSAKATLRNDPGHTVRGAGRNKAAPGGSALAQNYQDITQHAWAIARKISKYGTKPTYFFSNVFKPGAAGDISVLNEQLSHALNKDVQVALTINPLNING